MTNKLVLLTLSTTLLALGCRNDSAQATAAPGEADAMVEGENVEAGAASTEDEAGAFATEDDLGASAVAEGDNAEAEASAEDEDDEVEN